MNELQQALIALDMALTGVDRERAEQNCLQQKCTPDALCQNAYYLSDWGYSRVCFDATFEGVHIYLSNVSRDEVKAKWSECDGPVEALRTEATGEFARRGWY